MALLAPAAARASVPARPDRGRQRDRRPGARRHRRRRRADRHRRGPGGLPAEPGRVVHGPDFSREGSNRRLATLDTFGHGTHLAGLIAGTAPGARIVSLKVAGSQGETELGRVLRAHAVGARAPLRRRARHPRREPLARRRGRPRRLPARRARLGRRAAVARRHRRRRGRRQHRRARPHARHPGRRPVRDRRGRDRHVHARPTRPTIACADSPAAALRRPVDVVAPGTSMVSLRVPGSALDLEFPTARVGKDLLPRQRHLAGGRGRHRRRGAAALRPSGAGARPAQGAADAGRGRPSRPARGRGRGAVDLAGSLAAPVPDAEAVRQRWAPAVVDAAPARRRALKDSDAVGAVNAEWAGRRWSGRRWSGRRWSGSSWVSDG